MLYCLFARFHVMGMIRSLMIKFGLADLSAERTPISVMLLDDDERRHRWFKKRFDGDDLFIAATVDEAVELLEDASYDAIFLDHDLLPHHYESNDHDDFHSTGYAIAEFLHDRPELQRAATIIVHTRNSDAAVKMVQKLRDSGRNVEYCAFPYLDLKIKNYWKR
ncbi:MAG: cyclic-phosphate processing receiver domain-containing protein [Pyrinomonadaceae bacterium]